MEWSSLVPDIIVAVFGALLAAVITVVVARAAYRQEQHRRNIQLVRNLADDLAIRRAFGRITPRVSREGTDDADRCFRSVKDAQSQIGVMRDQISPDHDLRAVLQEMVLWCREYKNLTEREPERWQFAFMGVRVELVQRLRSIEQIVGLDAGSLPEPGTALASPFRR